jgi:hypothetical protein
VAARPLEPDRVFGDVADEYDRRDTALVVLRRV